MKIMEETATQLIVQHSPALSWLGCGFLVTIGVSVFAAPTTSPDEHLAAQVLACSVIAWGMIELITSGKFIVWTFDKSNNSLLVQSRSLLGTETSEYPLTEVRKVQVESRPTEGGETFGIEMVLVEPPRLHLCLDYGLPDFVAAEGVAAEGVRRICSFLERVNE